MKKIFVLVIVLMLICAGCTVQDEKEYFTEIYATDNIGFNLRNFPDKIVWGNEIQDIIFSDNNESSFTDDSPIILYNLSVNTETEMTKFIIASNGHVSYSVNLFEQPAIYLSEDNFNRLIEIIS